MIIKFIKKFFKENPTYKLASLGIAILLWLILLSRRDFEVTQYFDVEFRINDQYIVKHYSPTKINVHLIGSRAALKRVLDGTWNNSVVVDASNLNPGNHKVRLDRNKIDLPFGVKAIAVNPNTINFEIGRTPR